MGSTYVDRHGLGNGQRRELLDDIAIVGVDATTLGGITEARPADEGEREGKGKK